MTILTPLTPRLLPSSERFLVRARTRGKRRSLYSALFSLVDKLCNLLEGLAMVSALLTRPKFTTMAAIGLTGFGAYGAHRRAAFRRAADEELTTPSIRPVLASYKGDLFKLKVDYPRNTDTVTEVAYTDAPWLRVDFRADPERYAATIKDYCWEGNVSHTFKPFNNQVTEVASH